jgi:hypothetical protein
MHEIKNDLLMRSTWMVAHAHISHLMVCAVPTTARLAGRGLSPVRRSRLGLEDSQAPVIL